VAGADNVASAAPTCVMVLEAVADTSVEVEDAVDVASAALRLPVADVVTDALAGGDEIGDDVISAAASVDEVPGVTTDEDDDRPVVVASAAPNMVVSDEEAPVEGEAVELTPMAPKLVAEIGGTVDEPEAVVLEESTFLAPTIGTLGRKIMTTDLPSERSRRRGKALADGTAVEEGETVAVET